MTLLNEGEIKEYEPHVAGIAGIHVPQTGIVDYVKVCEKYAEVIQSFGGEINFSEKVVNIIPKDSNRVITNSGEYESKLVINCASLYSDKIARLTEKKLNVKIISLTYID